MDIKYSIQAFDPMSDVFVVKFFTENDIEVSLNLPIPFNEDKTAYLDGYELDCFIRDYAPVEQIKSMEAASVLDASNILSMVELSQESFALEKERKTEDLSLAFDMYCDQCHIETSLGFEVNADETANRNINGLLSVLENDDTVWFCDYNNEMRNLNKEQLKTILDEIILHTMKLYTTKWEIRDKIMKARNRDELNAIDFGPFEETYGE